MPRPYKTEIVTPATTRDLTRLETVKTELGITDTVNDDFLQLKIRQASDAIASSCNRFFHQETLRDSFSLDWAIRCNEGRPLVLSRIPVVSIVSILDGNSSLPVTEYEVDSASGLLWRTMSNVRTYWGWTYGGKIVVTFIGGYELLETLPYDIEQAAILLVKNSWYARSRDPLVKSVTINDVASYDFVVGKVGVGESGFPPDVENLIARYRRPQAA